MIEGQPTGRRRFSRLVAGFCPPLFAALVATGGPASAGEFDSGASVESPPRISGYITAGMGLGQQDRIGGRAVPFGPLPARAVVGAGAPADRMIMRLPGRLFEPADEAGEAR